MRSRKIKEWAIDYLKDTLPDYAGQSVYCADLAGRITEGPNANGVYEEDDDDDEVIYEYDEDGDDDYVEEEDEDEDEDDNGTLVAD